MGTERTDWREEALQLPLADLKKIYEHTRKMRKLMTSVLFMLLLGVITGGTFFYLYANFPLLLVEGSFTYFVISAAFSFVFLIWRYFVAFSFNGKGSSNAVLIISAVDLAIQAALFFVVPTPIYIIVAIITPIYLVLIRPYVIQADNDIAFLRAMPTFPFNERVSGHMIEVAEYKRKIQLIESAKGNIYSDNAEQIFDMPLPEPPQYEKGDTPEDYLQRKHMYIDGKFTKTSLTDEEFDRQDDELYERRMFTDRKKKREMAVPAPKPIEDDGRLQEFDFTEHGRLNETYIVSSDVFTDEFDRTAYAEPPTPDNYVISDDLIIEDMQYTEPTTQQ